MAEKWTVEVTLNTGATHTLLKSTGTKEHAQEALSEFLTAVGLFYSGKWIPVEQDRWLLRELIVEAQMKQV